MRVSFEEFMKRNDLLSNYASDLDVLYFHNFSKFVGTEKDILGLTLEEFEKTLKAETCFKLSEVINFRNYYRYYGNFLNTIVMSVFLPSMFVSKDSHKDPFMSMTQVQKTLYHTVQLIVYHELDINVEDDYNTKSLDCIFTYLSAYTKGNFRSIKVPPHIFSYVQKFRSLSSIHHIILKFQLNMKSFLLNRKKKKAVSIIENRWLEVILSPYTSIGSKHLDKLGREWIKF